MGLCARACLHRNISHHTACTACITCAACTACIAFVACAACTACTACSVSHLSAPTRANPSKCVAVPYIYPILLYMHYNDYIVYTEIECWCCTIPALVILCCHTVVVLVILCCTTIVVLLLLCCRTIAVLVKVVFNGQEPPSG